MLFPTSGYRSILTLSLYTNHTPHCWNHCAFSDAEGSGEDEEDAVQWEDTPTPRGRDSAGGGDEAATPNRATALSGAREGGGSGTLQPRNATAREDAFAQLFGLPAPSRERGGNVQHTPASTCASSCFAHDAPALWFGSTFSAHMYRTDAYKFYLQMSPLFVVLP